MPKFLADGKKKLTTVATRPVDVDAVTAAEATAATDISQYVLAPCNLGPSGSDTVDEKALADSGNSQTFGPSNFAGRSITLFRYFDSGTEQPDAVADATFQAFKVKGTTVRFLYRESAKDSADAFAAADEYRYVEYTTDDAQETEGDGWIKYVIPLAFAGTYSLDNAIVA